MTRHGGVAEVDDMIRPTNKPGGTKFKQQKLPAWQPVLSASTVLPALLAVGLSFIPLGIAFIVATNAVKEIVIDYTNCQSELLNNFTCSDIISENNSKNCFCNETLYLQEDFPGPVYMYYGLKSFYQNHRRYVKSRDDDQLAGSVLTSPSSDCEPFAADSNVVYAPCGAIANSLFSDIFTLYYNGTEVPIQRNGIAWPTDIKIKFRNPHDFNGTIKPPYWTKPISDMGGYENESLMVWMRTSAFPNFRKLYGKVDHSGGLFTNGLKRGNYRLIVNYNFLVSNFGGLKKMILSTTSFLGGRNFFLGIAYLVVGSLSLIVGFAFLVIHLRVGKRTQSSKAALSRSTPYFDTTMSDLMQSKMNACY